MHLQPGTHLPGRQQGWLIANSAIQLSQMDANSVGTVKIVDAAVTRAKLAPVSVVVLGQSSAQSIASDVAFHDILWTTEVEDADGLHAASSATILPVFAGVWMFTFRVAMESTMGSGILRGMFNGQEIARGPDVQATGTGLTIGLGAVTFIRRCNGLTDLAKAQVLHDSAGSRNTSPTVCFAEAVYLGA